MLNKKILLLVTAFSLIAMPLWARQGSSQLSGNFYFGISSADCTAWTGSTLGLYLGNDPTLWNNPTNEIGPAGGIGFGYRYFINDNVAIATGLAAVYKSFSVEYPANTAYDDITIEIGTTYIIIPAGVRAYFEYFYIGGGFYYGMAGDAEAQITYTTMYGTQTIKDTLNFDDDFGLYIDLGLDIPLSQQLSLDLGIRYERGLTAVYEEEYDLITDVMTRAVLFNAGICVLL
ncbi:MAG: porin family protein [Spirochaetes bacterium]|nr:porin family protein [Spirochaetota bacterium]